MTRRRKIISWSLFFVFLILVLMNVFAYVHAYKFTHFDPSLGTRTQDAKRLSFGQKIKTLFFGIDNPRPENKSIPDRNFQTINLRSNKNIACWLLKLDKPRGTVILFHGYGGEKSSMLDKAYVFLGLGYNTMLVDFMGSGGSEGNQTTVGFKEAEEVKSAFDFVKDSGEYRIILFGTSMGAVAILRAIADFNINPHAVIIECPFGTLLQTVQSRFKSMGVPGFPMANLLVFWGGVQNGFNANTFSPTEYSKQVSCPALLLYGEKDEKVSRKEIDQIFKNLNGLKRLETYPLAAHENYLKKYREKWTRDVSVFLNENR